MYDWYEKMDAQMWEDRANAAYECDVCGKIVDSVEEYDVDGDGIVSDEELAKVKAIHEAESAEEKADAQRRMAWVSIIAMLVFSAFLFLPIFPDSRIKALADLFGLLDGTKAKRDKLGQGITREELQAMQANAGSGNSRVLQDIAASSRRTAQNVQVPQ